MGGDVEGSHQGSELRGDRVVLVPVLTEHVPALQRIRRTRGVVIGVMRPSPPSGPLTSPTLLHRRWVPPVGILRRYERDAEGLGWHSGLLGDLPALVGCSAVKSPLRRHGRLAARSFAPVLAAAVVLGSAGCSPDQVGAAALVDGEGIRVAELQSATTDLLAARAAAPPDQANPQGAPTGGGAEQRDVLNRLILTELMDTVAESEGLQVSDGEVDALDRQFEQFLGPDRLRQELLGIGVPDSARRAFFRYQALRLAVGRKLVPGDQANQEQQSRQLEAAEQRLAQAGREVPVEVNPRYGRWVPAEARVEGAVSGGLSRTPEELRAAP